MNLRILTAFLFVSLVIITTSSGMTSGSTAVRRFGVFIGANNGGPELETLRYAVRDAESVSKLFMEMGGIKEQDNIFLVEPSLNEILSRLRTLRAKMVSLRSDYLRMELIFYYSGHSDEEGILLAKDKFTYKDLKDVIRDMPVDMRIIILDSCSSGALTKLKGGAKRPAFLIDNTIKTEGYAIITSSSSDEASQESDSLKGSYFTYALLSGLRGAANTGGNKRVTLNQAYQYAYQETLAKTEKTIGGAQHPSYDIHMSGSGDIVMTDLRQTTASLIIDADITGRLSIRDDSGILIAEVNKPEGSMIELGLEPGSYVINLKKGREIFQGDITINENERPVFSKNMLVMVETEKTVMRGNTVTNVEENYVRIPFSFSILPIISTTNKIIVDFQLNIGAGYCDRLEGTSLGFINITGEDAKYVDISLVGITVHDFTGFQGSLITYTGHDFRGAQFSLVNIVVNDFSYFQSGYINIDLNNFNGFQAGLFNLDPSNFNGMELGLININGMTRGLQVGLINVSAGMDGESVGLASIVLSNGQTHGEAWIDEAGFVNAAFINGSKIIYNIYKLGINTSASLWSYGLGLGVHLPADPFYFNFEISVSSLAYIDSWVGNNTLSQFRIYTGWDILDHFAFIAGLSLNFYNIYSGQAPGINPVYNLSKAYNNNLIIWPGIFAGVEF